MYPSTSILITIGRFGIALLVALSYPLQSHPCRACIHTLTTGWGKPSHSVLSQSEENDGDEDVDEDEQGGEGQGEERGLKERDQVIQVSKEMSQRKFVGVTTGIIVAGLAVAMIIDELEIGKLLPTNLDVSFHSADDPSWCIFRSMSITVLAFVGATGSTIISFILPGLFYFSLFRAGWKRWAALALAIYGIFVMVFW